MSNLHVRIRDVRSARGIPQNQLAATVGLTRQALGAIEAGRYVPNTVVALRLARALGCRVEDLWLDAAPATTVPVSIVGAAEPGARLAVARVRQRTLAFPLSGERVVEEGFAPADARLLGDTDQARLHDHAADLDAGAVLMGCDPAFRLLSTRLPRNAGRLLWRGASSTAALEALARGEAHCAATHLVSAGGGAADLEPARRALAATGGEVIAFARWEQGLMLARGNPRDLRGVADLADPRVRIINRETGSGSRRLLDELLARAGVPAASIRGYDRCVPSHFAAARAVAAGDADAAIGLRAVASACDLDFVALAQVRCDLALPADLCGHPVVAAMLDLLQGAALRADLASLPGYDASETGSSVCSIPCPN